MTDNDFAAEWLTGLLAGIEQNVPAAEKGRLFESCALAHYRAVDMEEIVARYSGDLPGFLGFLSESWHWVIDYDPIAGRITADENKSACVCPLVQAGLVKGAAAGAGGLCACSEQFAERMFGAVLKRPVRASVARSIMRGDPSCVYVVEGCDPPDKSL